MKQVLALISGVMLLAVSGCGLTHIDDPVPFAYEVWKKRGVSEMDVKKALLECGYPDTWGGGAYYKNVTRNDSATMNFCMEKAGFKDRALGGSRFWCRAHPDLPACQPGAPIPDRSVKKRLNSAWCKNEPGKYGSLCKP